MAAGASAAAMTRRGWILFAAMCVIWGIPYLMIRVAVRELSPASLVLFRTGVSALLLLPLALARHEVLPVLRRWRAILVFAGIEIALPWICLASAERRVTSSLAGLIIAAVPLVAVALAALTGARHRPGRSTLLGLALGVGGVAAILGLDLKGANTFGIAELGVVAVCYAVGPAILAAFLADLPPFGVIAVSLTVSAVVYAPIAWSSFPSEVPSGRVIASVAGLSAVCTALAFVLFFALITEAGPVRATLITYVNPAVAAVLGVAVLSEPFTTGMGVGFVLVLAGSLLATRTRSPRPEVAFGGDGEAAVGTMAARVREKRRRAAGLLLLQRRDG
jgi:drug/metabolite transporter (DMT)-like permease